MPAQIFAQINKAKEGHLSESFSLVNDTVESFDNECEPYCPISDNVYKEGLNAIGFMCKLTASNEMKYISLSQTTRVQTGM